ncbi:MAG: hypothetical protein DYG93_08380 [Leptolyngbya sp. PLA2]|nr:hypothetical protein [Leptolyngbya sp.]MCE7971663.1 hypothetical protein [Leptolyngbya sp. PL-A2]
MVAAQNERRSGTSKTNWYDCSTDGSCASASESVMRMSFGHAQGSVGGSFAAPGFHVGSK